jgi:hypothetical protein
MRMLLIAAAAAGVLLSAPAMAASPADTPAAQIQTGADHATTQNFSARRYYHPHYWHHRYYHRHWGWHHRHWGWHHRHWRWHHHRHWHHW